MPTIVDYASLTQAILDHTHRPTISTFTDYFIQGAQEEINNDIFDRNFGQGIRLMENAYPATQISANGTAPVPADWLAPKLMTILGTDGAQHGMEFKDPEWIYNRYPMRQASGIPGYLARDVQTGGSFPSTSASLSITTTANQTAFSLAAGPAGAQVLFVALDGVLLVPTTDYTISGTTLTTTNGTQAGQDLFVQFLAASTALGASNTSVFIFGPFPDSQYTIQGTYYQQAPLLSVTQTTNWMVTSAPHVLLAACMKNAGKFLKDPAMVEGWNALYEDQLSKLIARDTSERYGSGPLVIDVGTPS